MLLKRCVRWRRDGTWDRVLVCVQMAAEVAGAIPWTVSVDSTDVRAHQHAPGARRQPSASSYLSPAVPAGYASHLPP
jgi:transposase